MRAWRNVFPAKSKFSIHRCLPFIVGYTNINETGRQGGLNVPFTRIVEVFGEPGRGDTEHKITFRWLITFADGTVASIYDYRVNRHWLGEHGLTPHQIRTGHFRAWNVGGKNPRSIYLVRKALRVAGASKVRN